MHFQVALSYQTTHSRTHGTRFWCSALPVNWDKFTVSIQQFWSGIWPSIGKHREALGWQKYKSLDNVSNLLLQSHCDLHLWATGGRYCHKTLPLYNWLSCKLFFYVLSHHYILVFISLLSKHVRVILNSYEQWTQLPSYCLYTHIPVAFRHIGV